MVKRRTIDARLRRLEEKLLEPPRPTCKVCGAEYGGPTIWEEHHEDGVVSYDRRPCPGCTEVPSPGGVRSIIICPHGCWCESDPAKVEAAPKVYLDECDDETWWKYADGAAKHSRLLQEETERNGELKREHDRD